MANKIILKSGETAPTVDNLEELEPGIDKTTNKLYTKINGQIVSLNDTSWGNIQNKPETFPPSEHTHEIVDIENLESEITLIKDTIEEQTSQIEKINTDIEDLNNNKMDSPNNQTDSSVTGYFLKQSSANQGHWFYLQEADQNTTGLLSSSGYNLFLNKIGATNTGSQGQFLMRNSNSSSSTNKGTWTYITLPEIFENTYEDQLYWNILSVGNLAIGSCSVQISRRSTDWSRWGGAGYVSTGPAGNFLWYSTAYRIPFARVDTIQATFQASSAEGSAILMTYYTTNGYLPQARLYRSTQGAVSGTIHFLVFGKYIAG